MDTGNQGGHPRIDVFWALGRWLPGRNVWRISIGGRIWRPTANRFRQRLARHLLARWTQLPHELWDHRLVNGRLRPFLGKGCGGVSLQVRLGDGTYALRRRSRRSGYFRGSIDLVHPLESSGGWAVTRQLPIDVAAADHRIPSGRASALLVPPQGLSVISDIDDTVKVSRVGERRELLLKTFFQPFETVAGMQHVYRRWSDQGWLIHYVSSSPWQLHEPLVQMLHQAGFPCHSIHLRPFRMRDHLATRLPFPRRPGKAKVMAWLIARYPQREFLLVGDSGEGDAEVYRRVSRRFPDQVRGVFIRELPHRPLADQRLTRGLDRSGRWLGRRFSTPEQLDQISREFLRRAAAENPLE